MQYAEEKIQRKKSGETNQGKNKAGNEEGAKGK
jgi:hypothetical protein